MRPILFLLALTACAPAPLDEGVLTPGVAEPSQEPDAGGVDVPGAVGRAAGEVSAPGSVVVLDEGRTTLVADPDDGDVLVFDVELGLLQELAIGGEPTGMVAVGPDDVFVTQRLDGSIARLSRQGGSWALVDTVPVGLEPYGIDASDDGTLLFVALSQEGAVVALHTDDYGRAWRANVPGEPRWILAGSDDLGQAGVFVAGAYTTSLAWVRGARSVELLELPAHHRVDPFNPAEVCAPRLMDLRMTGAMAVAPGGTLYVPTLYADTRLNDMLTSARSCAFRESPVVYYAPPNPELEDPKDGISRWNPAVQEVTFDGGHLASGATLLAVADTAPGQGWSLLRSPVTSVHALGDGRLLAMQTAAGGAVQLDPRQSDPYEGLPDGFERVGRQGFRVAPLAEAAVVDGELHAWSLDRRVVSMGARPDDLASGVEHAGPLSDLPIDVRLGRADFLRSDDEGLATQGSGAACANCHAEGRTDGFTWQLDIGDRQTPSLAGPVTQTHPVTWALDVDSVAAEARLTSTGRMGGRALPDAVYQRIETYLGSTRTPVRDVVPEHLAASWSRGRAVFRDPAVGCATCHTGALGTDNQSHTVLDRTHPTNTPPLLGVAATPPYLMKGEASTLRRVLEIARSGTMGDTSDLTPREMDDLEVYVTWFGAAVAE